jgi:hypothetical protein
MYVFFKLTFLRCIKCESEFMNQLKTKCIVLTYEAFKLVDIYKRLRETCSLRLLGGKDFIYS